MTEKESPYPCPACGVQGELSLEYASENYCNNPKCRVQHYDDVENDQ